MDLLFSPEQEAIADAVRDLVIAAVPLSWHHDSDRPGAGSRFPAGARYWGGLSELGLFGLAVSEDKGGAGLALADEVVAFRELGRALAPGPLVGTVLAARVAASAGDQGLLDDLLSGRARVAVAFAQPGSPVDVGERVRGVLRCHDAEAADKVLVCTPTAFALVDVAVLQPQLVDAMDPTAPVTVAKVDSSARIVVGAGDHAAGLWSRGILLTAAQHCGMAEATRDMSAEYARTREQFGKPIGVFQAVKHRCAEMAVRAELAHFQTVYAALATDKGLPDAAFGAASAGVVARRAAHQNAADNIQNHGAMGFTVEADPHLYTRRILALQHAFGSVRQHLESVAQFVAEQPGTVIRREKGLTQ